MSKNEQEQRPMIFDIHSGKELKRWYWLKAELIAHARECGIKTSGGKFVILDRLGHFLDTGKKNWPGDVQTKVRSKFNWHTEPLFEQTIITDSYKNSQNVRRFFIQHVGHDFKFNVAFMDWMKGAEGKPLGDAVVAFMAQKDKSAAAGFKTKIKPHNQFNQYTRDIMAANPKMSPAEARRIWELKRALPSETGRHIYEKSDLDLKT